MNVNPYDTGFDENSHVMKFAALAREVFISPAPAPVQRVPVVGPGKTQGTKIKQLGPMTLKDPEITPHPYSRKVRLSMGNPKSGKAVEEAIFEVREGWCLPNELFAKLILLCSFLSEDEPAQEEGDNDEEGDFPINPLVDALFDEVESLRLQVCVAVLNNLSLINCLKLFEAEMRCALVEAETREEVMREMEERMAKMEEIYSRRLKSEVSFHPPIVLI